MVPSPRGASVGKWSIQRRRPMPLAPKRPPAKNPSAPPREGARNKVRSPRARPLWDNPSPITSMPRSGSAGIPAPPPPRASLAKNALPPPSRSVGSSVGSVYASYPLVAGSYLKLGTAVRVRTRTTVRMAEKTLELWLWLPATVVSAAEDGSYEIVYKGKLPRNDPFATVLVANDHVVPEKQAQMMPLTSRATSSSDAAVSKIPDVQPAARPTTAGKSLRLINKLTSGTQPLPRAASSCACANLTCIAASKTSKMPTGMIVRSHSSEMHSPPPPRPATTGSRTSSQTKPAPRPTTAGKRISVIRRT